MQIRTLLTAAFVLSSLVGMPAVPLHARATQQVAVTLDNPSFETPVLAEGSDELLGASATINPPNSWLFNSNSTAGITSRALNADDGSLIPPPDGAQAAVLQNEIDTFGQIVTWRAGFYKVSFKAMAQSGSANPTFAVDFANRTNRAITITTLSTTSYEQFESREVLMPESRSPMVFDALEGFSGRVQIDDVRLTFVRPARPTNVFALVFNDRNANARLDFTDRPLRNWNVSLINPSTGAIRNATTSAIGLVSFTGVPFGTYRVCETLQDGWRATQPITTVAGRPCFTITTAPAPAAMNGESAQIARNEADAAVVDAPGVTIEPISPDGPALPLVSRTQVFMPMTGSAE
jgi:hypothetical protein